MNNPLVPFSKKIALTCAFMALVINARAQFTFPVYEPFAYAEGERLGTTGFASASYWTFGNTPSATSSPLVSTTNALSYPGLLSDPNSPARGILGATGTGRSRGAPMTTQTSGTIYSSFLFKLINPPAAPRYFYGLNGTASGTPSASSGLAAWINQAGQFQISKNNATTPATNLTYAIATNTTHLVVIAYKFGTGSNNNEVDLWLDPVNLGNNSIIPTPTISSTNNANSTALASLCLYASSSQGAMTNVMDEIRVDNNWAGVTVPSASPGNIYGVTGGGSGCPGTAFAVGLNGSDSGVNYLLYTNGVFNGQTVAGSGASVSFGMQTGTAIYSVLASNTSTANVGWMSNTVSVSVLAGPMITTQPLPALVATNGQATFSVTATGLGLNYQWYKNGVALTDGGHISGSATSTLVISPATTTDAATTANGYYLVISNSCGLTATSTTVSLTLDAPANLYWIGNNPNSNWDLSTTANFATTDGGPASTVFHAGDDVTLDDSGSPAYVITLVGNNLSPTVISNNSGNYYVFTGSGSISGPGSLVMNGNGVWDITTANTYTGGTTVNSGYILVSNANYQSLGSGPLTLNGGTVVTEFAGSAGLGLSNNVSVTANGGTIQFNGTGSEASVLFGSLTGPSGSTLTIQTQQSPSTPPRMRLYNTNFTANENINLTSPNVATFFLAPYNSAGSQVYNGVIYGNGSIIMRNGGGTAVFNGANTFSGNLQLSTGYTGAGIDSAGSPGSVTSGPFGTANIVLASDGEAATANASIFASGGAHTIGNNVIYTNLAGDLFTLFVGGTNNLTLSGTIDLTDPNGGSGAVRVFNITNTAQTIFSGALIDNSLGSSQGNGIEIEGSASGGGLLLKGANTFTGSTVVTNGGILGGSGSLAGPLIVQTNGTLSPGLQTSLNTFTVNNSVTLQAGSTTRVAVNSAGSHD